LNRDGEAELTWSSPRNAESPVSRLAAQPQVRQIPPDGILTSGASVVVVDVRYLHTTLVGYFLTDNVELTDRFYSRPRRVPLVERIG